MAVTDVKVEVALPPATAALAQGIEKLVLDIFAAKKAGATGVALVTASVTASIADLAPALASAAGIGVEATSEPIGIAEAFAIAGFGVARGLIGK